VSHVAGTALAGFVGTVGGMTYTSDLTDEQWGLLEPVFNAPGKRGPKHAPDLRRVVDAMLYVSHTGCQWRFLPGRPGPGRGCGRSSAAGHAMAPGREH
jgi:transposase